jgi:hypothetical protein
MGVVYPLVELPMVEVELMLVLLVVVITQLPQRVVIPKVVMMVEVAPAVEVRNENPNKRKLVEVH